MSGYPLAFPHISVPGSETSSPGNDNGREEILTQAFIAHENQVPDDTLLERMKANDRSALAVLFRRYAGVVRRVGLRILHDEGEADDLVQEVFLFLFRKAAIFDPGKTSAQSWILQMSYHRAFDRRRYLSARRFYDMEELNDDRTVESRFECLEEGVLQNIMGRDLLTRYRQALTSEQTQTLELFFFEGLSLREIADQTGQTYANIRNHYYRALSRLRSHLLPPKPSESPALCQPRSLSWKRGSR